MRSHTRAGTRSAPVALWWRMPQCPRTDSERRPDILEHTHCVETIRAIVGYECYERIIRGCRLAAAELGCKLIEVEPELRSGANLHEAKLRKS
jgi:hypothetical protein